MGRLGYGDSVSACRGCPRFDRPRLGLFLAYLAYMVSEDDLQRIRSALSSASRPSRELDLPAALHELHAWLTDDHQAANAFAVHWVSLLGDVLGAAADCGPLLRGALLADEPHSLDELLACKRVLKNARRPPDASLRRRIERATNHLSRAYGDGPALVAAFRDLQNAKNLDQAETAARLLVALTEVAGHDRQWFPSRLRNVLADDGYAVAAERGTALPDDAQTRAGATPSERVELVEDILRRPAEKGDVVVWLRFLNADLGWPPLLHIGKSVCLFEGRWLRSVLAQRPSQIEDTAPEAVDDDSFNLRLFVRVDSEANDESAERDEERPSYVYIRVAAAHSTASQGLSIARRTADALSGVASLYGTPPRLWQLEDSFVSFTEHGSGGASFAGPPPIGLSVDDSVSLRNDHTGRSLADVADRLGEHLPVKDPAIEQAATLLSWLRTARLTEGPPRLLLCDRVVEQVSGWAGFDEPRRFVTEYLRLSWALGRVRNNVANTAFAAAIELQRHPQDGASVLSEFADESAGFGGTVNLKRFLELIDQVTEEMGDVGDVSERLRRLADRVRSPGTAAAWLQELLERFDRLEGRRRRTRNALVHGGPLAQGTVDTIVEFSESLAVNALAASIEGRLAGRDIIDHFLERRSRVENSERRLRNGEPLSEALFWADDD